MPAMGMGVILRSRWHKAELAPKSTYDDRLSGGLATVFDETSHALTIRIEGLNARDERVHELGDQIFEAKFVAPPSTIFGGLGSIFNNVSCITCHPNSADSAFIPTAIFYYMTWGRTGR